MTISDKFFRVNGMKVILDLQGLPDKICDAMKCVTNCQWLSLKQKINLLDKIRKNYLTSLHPTPIFSDSELKADL